ncbi:hypothetical protein [Kaarinaea lacus]
MILKCVQHNEPLLLQPAEPLWQRVPTRDAEGKPYSDFMMIIPRLGKKSEAVIKATLHNLESVLACYQNDIVFADLNLKLNVLWVTVRPVPGICLELPTAIKMKVPEALLVSQKFHN